MFLRSEHVREYKIHMWMMRLQWRRLKKEPSILRRTEQKRNEASNNQMHKSRWLYRCCIKKNINVCTQFLKQKKDSPWPNKFGVAYCPLLEFPKEIISCRSVGQVKNLFFLPMRSRRRRDLKTNFTDPSVYLFRRTAKHEDTNVRGKSLHNGITEEIQQ